MKVHESTASQPGKWYTLEDIVKSTLSTVYTRIRICRIVENTRKNSQYKYHFWAWCESKYEQSHHFIIGTFSIVDSHIVAQFGRSQYVKWAEYAYRHDVLEAEDFRQQKFFFPETETDLDPDELQKGLK